MSPLLLECPDLVYVYIILYNYSTTYSSVAVAIDYCYKRLWSQGPENNMIIAHSRSGDLGTRAHCHLMLGTARTLQLKHFF